MQVIWSGYATQRQKEIVNRIAADNPDAALRLLDAFEESARKLGRFPPTDQKVIRPNNSSSICGILKN